MTGLLILIANLLSVVVNVSLLAVMVKLYTEVHKKKTIEGIGKGV